MKKCQAKCSGVVDHSIDLMVELPNRGEKMFHPCGECGLMHWESSSFAFYRRDVGSFIYFKNGELVDCYGQVVRLKLEAKTERKAQ